MKFAHGAASVAVDYVLSVTEAIAGLFLSPGGERVVSRE